MRKTIALGTISLFTSAILYWLGYSMIRPVMSLYFSDEGYRAAAIGVFMALNSVLPIVLAMPIGSWIDKIGTRRAVLYGSIISAASGVAFMIGGAGGKAMIGVVLFGQIINGIGGLLSWGALQAAASLSVGGGKDKKRGNRSLSNFTFVNSLAQLAGPSLGGFLSDTGGYSTIFIVFALVNGVALLLAFLLPGDRTKPQAQETAKGAEADWKRALWQSYVSGYGLMRRNKPFSLAIMLNGIMYMMVDLRTTFFPLYLDNIGLNHAVIGAVLSVSALSTLLIRPVTGYLVNRMGQYGIMMSSMVIGGICLLLLALEPAVWVLSIIMFLWGASTGINQPVSLIMVSRSVEAREQGMGMTLRTMSNRVVSLTNPLFFGAVTTAFGLTLGFGAMGLVLLGAGYVYRRQHRLRSEELYKEAS